MKNTAQLTFPAMKIPYISSPGDSQRDIPRTTPSHSPATRAFDLCYLTLIHTALLRKLNGTGGLSAVRSSRPLKSIVSLASRGGVPVFSLPTANPSLSSVCASPMDGWSPRRPAGCFSSPTWIMPLRNVPVVRMTLPACTVLPSPETASFQRCIYFTINEALVYWSRTRLTVHQGLMQLLLFDEISTSIALITVTIISSAYSYSYIFIIPPSVLPKYRNPTPGKNSYPGLYFGQPAY